MSMMEISKYRGSTDGRNFVLLRNFTDVNRAKWGLVLNTENEFLERKKGGKNVLYLEFIQFSMIFYRTIPGIVLSKAGTPCNH